MTYANCGYKHFRWLYSVSAAKPRVDGKNYNSVERNAVHISFLISKQIYFVNTIGKIVLN